MEELIDCKVECVQTLMNTIQKTQIKPGIQTQDLVELLKVVKKKTIIPLQYYQKIIHISTTNNKCKCCNRKSIYYDNNDYYCWQHVQTSYIIEN